MKTSAKGLQALEQREGRKLVAYRDTKGIWTIGVGHTGPEVQDGLVWTEQQVEDALAQDVTGCEQCINTYIVVPLTQDQFDALVSLIFNIGVHAFVNSSVLRRLNQGDYMGAALAILMWEKNKELVGRRESEYNQFIAGT